MKYITQAHFSGIASYLACLAVLGAIAGFVAYRHARPVVSQTDLVMGASKLLPVQSDPCASSIAIDSVTQEFKRSFKINILCGQGKASYNLLHFDSLPKEASVLAALTYTLNSHQVVLHHEAGRIRAIGSISQTDRLRWKVYLNGQNVDQVMAQKTVKPADVIEVKYEP